MWVHNMVLFLFTLTDLTTISHLVLLYFTRISHLALLDLTTIYVSTTGMDRVHSESDIDNWSAFCSTELSLILMIGVPSVASS